MTASRRQIQIFFTQRGDNKPKTQPFTFVDTVDTFSEKTGSDLFNRLIASVPLNTEVETGIFVINMNNGTGQSTSQLWNISSVYRKKWTIVDTLKYFPKSELS